ncbi:MAG: hypothetical protein AAGA96_15245 [Verrucomicrobiota bacterium]
MNKLATSLFALFFFCATLHAEEFFVTANEALILGEIALKQNGIETDDLVLFRMEIKPAPQQGVEWDGAYKPIYEQMRGRDAWILMYQGKKGFTPMTNYVFRYAVLLFSKTEAAVVKTQATAEE